MLEKWKERLKRFGPKAGYPAFYLLCLLIFLTWTFPFDKLRDRIVTQFNSQQKNSQHPQELQIDDLDSSFLTGVKAKGVRLLSPATEPGKAPSVLSIDQVRARISLLGLLVGNKDVSFKVDAFDGTVTGTYEDSGKDRAIDLEFDNVDVGRIDTIAASIGFPIDGKLTGTMKLALPEGKTSKANGNLSLDVKDANAGNTKELALKTPMGPFSLPRLKIGNFNVVGDAKDGVIKISKVAASGGDVDVSGDGKVQMRDNATDSHLDINLKFKINDSYRTKNDKTKLLFGAPGSKEKPMLEMDPKMGRAKTADGAYAMRVGGTLGRPDVQPGAGGGGSK